jgi:hypothetical protein
LREPLEAALAASSEYVDTIVRHEALEVTVFTSLPSWAPRGTGGWAAGWASTEAAVLQQGLLAAANYTYEGTLSIIVTRTLMVTAQGEEHHCAFEHLWLGYLISALAIAGHVYRTIPAAGLLSVEMSLRGLEGAASFAQTDGELFYGDLPRVTDGSYYATGDFSARELATEPQTAAQSLLERFFVSFLPEDENVFARIAAQGGG